MTRVEMLDQALTYFNDDAYQEAYALFESLFAEYKDTEATYFLGLFYDNGYGVEKDEAKAINYYKRAARAGSKDAAYQLQTKSQTTIVRI